MAWAEKRGDGYRAGWRDAHGVRRYKGGFTHKKFAMNHAVTEEQAAQGASLTDPKATFGDWLDKWLQIRNVEASTDKKDRERIETHVRPQWGTVPIRKITKLAAEEWVSELDEIVAPWTVRRIWYNFATPMRWAHERGAVLPHPFPYMLSKGTLPTPSPGHERYLPWEKLTELEAQLEHITDRLPALLLLGTGARWGEMAGLHRSKVDLERQTVQLVETWAPAGDYVKGYPKSRQARTVPLPDWLCVELRTYFAAVPDAGMCGLRHAAGTPCTSDLVIRGERGRPLNREHYAFDVLKPALARIGVDDFRIHDSRHTFASWLLQAGRPIEEVSKLLGHHSIVVTQKYAHLSAAHLDSARNALSRGQTGDNAPKGDPDSSRPTLTLVS